MALNKFMHPKNLYKKKQPNFKDLAIKYEEFRRHTTQDEAGKVHIDFKDASSLKALSWALLKDDFDLDVELPLDRLIPTVPLRLNYLLWLTDLMGKRKTVTGIDIGCGASCVYPLLGAKVNQWSFIATESDETNFQFAKRNVEKNELSDKINIVKVENGEDIFGGLEVGKKYDFTMCNPPFFGSNLEAYAMTNSRNADRAEPNSVCTASEAESITPGGEVEFVRKMIKESLELKDRIRVFTTMLGKKSSVGVLKEELRKAEIKNFGSYEFCQGRTMRWGLGWSHESKIRFPKSLFQQTKTPEKSPLVLNVERNIGCAKYEIQSLGKWLITILEEVSLKYAVIMDCEAMWSATVTAHENTWSHQRRKRRAEKRAESESSEAKRLSPGPDLNSNTKLVGASESTDSEKVLVTEKSENAEDVPTCHGDTELTASRSEGAQTTSSSSEGAQTTSSSSEGAQTTSSSSEGAQTTPSSSEGAQTTPSSSEGAQTTLSSSEDAHTLSSSEGAQTESETIKPTGDTPSPSGDDPSVESHSNSTPDNAAKGETSKNERPVLFSAWFTFKLDDDEDIYLELKWLKGNDKEAMQQVLQLIKNRLRSPVS